MPPALHVLAPHHTIPNDDFSHCAFTGKALRFSKMMKPFGYKIFEYANKGSTSEADVKLVMLNEDEYKKFYKPETSSPGAQAQTGTMASNLFNFRVGQALREHAKPGDIVCHIWTAQAHIPAQFPGLIHVETGIGYPNDSIGNAYRIFESEVWRSMHWGRACTPGGVVPNRFDMNPARTWIIPNYFDVEEWPLSTEPENAVVFMARFVVDKGIDMLRRVIKAWHAKHPDDGMRFILAGMGDFAGWLAGSDFTPAELMRIDYHGVVLGRDRAKLCGRGKAFLLPSIFVEPFGGSAVESLLVGTPAITPTFGAFTETIEQGVTGFRCRTVDDYVAAIENAPQLDRATIRTKAVVRFSLETCGKQYDEVFRTLSTQAFME